MNPFSFVKDIAQGFNRNRATEDYICTIKELRESTIKMLEDFAEHQGNKPLSKSAAKWDTGYSKGVPAAPRKKFHLSMLETFKANLELSGDIEDMMMKAIPKEATAEALDYKAATLVQYAQVLSFASRYTRKLLLVVLADTSAENPKATVPFKSGLAKPEIVAMQKEVANFYAAMNTLALVAKNFAKSIKEIPEINVELSDYEMQKEVSGVQRLDPFQMGFFSARWNPIYHIRMAYTDWVINSYESAKADRMALEYRIQALKDSAEGQSNPKLERAIEYHTEQLQKVNHKIHQIEESVNERR